MSYIRIICTNVIRKGNRHRVVDHGNIVKNLPRPDQSTGKVFYGVIDNLLKKSKAF
jgi:uncharacterized protein YwbE